METFTTEEVGIKYKKHRTFSTKKVPVKTKDVNIFTTEEVEPRIVESETFNVLNEIKIDPTRDIISLGACSLDIGPVPIKRTLEGSNTQLIIDPITIEMKTEESKESKGFLHIGDKVSFKCSIPFTTSIATRLGLLGTSTTGSPLPLIRTELLKIDGLDGVLSVVFHRATIKLKTTHNFKKDSFHSIDLEAVATRNQTGELYSINFN